jgi:hypothetical protein
VAILACARITRHDHGVPKSAITWSTLAISVDDSAAPPSEFCIFRAGVNASSKGDTIFDEAAAASVMAAYQRAGVDMMIDLEHAALIAPDARPDSSDARGWARLELRPDGSLWAVDVKWTPDGARRLAEKTQRYISPAFITDEEGRVLEIVNCALCAMPATCDAPALVAASRGALARNTPAATVRSTSMDPEQLKAAIDALNDGSLAKALGLDATAKPSDILDVLQAAVSALGPASAPDSSADNPAPDPATAETADAPMTQALSRTVCLAVGCETFRESLDRIKVLRELEASANAATVAAENAQRVELVGALVTLGIDTPATAWADAEKKIPCDRLAKEPLADLGKRVSALRAARPAKAKIEPPVKPVAKDASDPPDVTTLSAAQLDACRKAKITPEEFIARRSTLNHRRIG